MSKAHCWVCDGTGLTPEASSQKATDLKARPPTGLPMADRLDADPTWAATMRAKFPCPECAGKGYHDVTAK